MASALEAVLRLKADEAARAQQQSDNLTQAVNIFQRAKESVQSNQLQLLQVKSNLAKDGLKMNQDGSFSRDDSLLSESDRILQKAKLADAAKSLGDRNLFNQITGNSQQQIDTTQVNPQEAQINPNDETSQLYQVANQVDPFTGKPTAEAEQAKAQLELNKSIRTDHQKQLFTARKSFDVYQADANQALVAIDKIESQAKNLPEYRRGGLNQITGRIDAAYKEFSKDKEVTRYLGVVSQELIPMARKLMEEKGPITEFDVARVEKGLGDITAPLEDKKFLLNELRDKVKQALLTKSKIAEISQEDIEGKYSDLFKRAGTSSKKNSPTQEKDQGLFESDTKPTDIKGKISQNINDMISPAASFVNNALAVPFVTSPKDMVEKSGGKYPESSYPAGKALDMAFGVAGSVANLPVRGAISLLKGVQAANNINKAEQLMKQTEPFAKGAGVKAAEDLVKLKPVEVMDKTVKNVRQELLKKSDDLSQAGYVQREHAIYSDAIGKVKASDVEIKNAPKLLDEFAANNKDEFGNFITPEIKRAYTDLSEALAKNGKVTEKQLHDAVIKLKGNFKDVVDRTKSLNLSAVRDLSEGYTGEAASAIKSANLRYSQFKPVENDINDLIGLYGKRTDSRATDTVINGLLKSDLSKNPNQARVLDKIGQETGIDIKGATTYYGGKFRLVEGTNPNFFGVNIRKSYSSIKDMLKGKPSGKSEVNSESMQIIKKIKDQAK